MKKYRTYFNSIDVIEIEKESESSVWIDGRRRSKDSSWQQYFDNFQEAKNYLIDEKIKEIDRIAERLNSVRIELNKIEKLEEAK